MISKDTFCKALRMIQDQEKINDGFAKALETVGNGHYVFDGGGAVLEALLMVLKETINDKFDYIGWWLYETSDFMVWTEDESREWCLKEPEALYDFIVEESEK